MSRQSESAARLRLAHRDKKQCAGCACRSETYWCPRCQPAPPSKKHRAAYMIAYRARQKKK